MVDPKKLLRSLLVFAPGLQDARFRAEAKLVRALRRPYQPEFAALPHLPIDNPLVLDIGCYRGISIETILAMRPDARVIGFEANAALAADTKRWFAAEPRVEIHGFGLGSEDSALEIHVPRYRGYRLDGLASFDPTSGERLVKNGLLYWFDPSQLHTDTIRTTIRRLDDLELSPQLIKIYVQGYEEPILDGAAETIRKHEPILLAPAGFPGIDAKLRAKGYRRFRWWQGKFVPEGDGGLYVYFMTAARYEALDPRIVAAPA
jgi:FkbM family methyltransferase